MFPRANCVSSGLILTFSAACLRCLFSLLPLHGSLLKIRVPSQQRGACAGHTGSSTVAATCAHRHGQHLPWTVAHNAAPACFGQHLASAAPAPKTLIYPTQMNRTPFPHSSSSLPFSIGTELLPAYPPSYILHTNARVPRGKSRRTEWINGMSINAPIE